MSYLVLAYPELSSKDFQLIQEFRKDHDALYYSVVAPHFTIVFPIVGVEEKDFISEIKKQSTGIQPIDFTIRCATINKNAFNDHYHIFLVPDEGYSQMVRLHDRLYNHLLLPHLHLDLDFIPHIGIASSKDKYECKRLSDEWNDKSFSIQGTITELTIVDYQNDVVSVLQKIPLG
jgi:2'-5' RNA ligase